jgi:type IV secretion system protein VirB9
MRDINFHQGALVALIAMGLVGGGDLLSGCSTTPQPTPPSYAETVAPAPTPSAPKLTGADILARQPKEVQDAIQHYQEGSYPTWHSAHGMLVPYDERMDPIPVDCAPNYHVDLFLLPGETATGVAAGDAERWLIGPSTDTSHGGPAALYIKCKDVNLNADASVFTSAGRTIPLLLKSKAHSQLRWIKLYDPETIIAEMHAADAAPTQTAAPDPIAPAPGTKLNVAYSINGPDVAWKPHRAFDDGAHVWIEMPQMLSPVRPILLGDDHSQLNYRVRGQYFETDSLFSKGTLVADNQKVFIQRGGQ